MISEGSCDTEDWSNDAEKCLKGLNIEYGPTPLTSKHETNPPVSGHSQ